MADESRKSSHSFSPDKLNDAFGFATIVACLDSAKHVLAHPLLRIDPFAASFLVYFFVFRTKMYIDDSAHAFTRDRKLGSGPIDVGSAM